MTLSMTLSIDGGPLWPIISWLLMMSDVTDVVMIINLSIKLVNNIDSSFNLTSYYFSSNIEDYGVHWSSIVDHN